MILDTHVHSKEFSYDSPLPIREAILRGKAAGLDGLCVTDHEHMGMRRLAEQLTRRHDFLVLVGMEFLTFEGDLLVFGLDTVPDRAMHADELVSLVNRQGGCAVSAHPFRDNGRGLGNEIRGLHGLHGLEALNGSTRPHHNAMASDLAFELGLARLGGSDAHLPERVGLCATRFLEPVRNERDLIRAVRAGLVEPVVLEDGRYRTSTAQADRVPVLDASSRRTEQERQYVS